MKITDEKITEALKDKKSVKNSHGLIYKFDQNNVLVSTTEHGSSAPIDDSILGDDFEIIESGTTWDEIIREKYLCKFWDGDIESNNPREIVIDFLNEYNPDNLHPFRTLILSFSYEHCRPLRTDEVKLVTDEKGEKL